MTSDDHRVDRPFQRGRTGELGGTTPVRGPSERSGTRLPPPDLGPDIGTGGPVTNAELSAQLRAIMAANAQLEGRLMGEFSEQTKRVRNEVLATADRRVETAEHKAEATMAQARRIEHRWKGWAAGFGGLAGLAIASCGGALWTSLSTNRQVVQVAEGAAEAKSAELEEAHAETRKIAENNTKRLDGVEDKIDRILVALEGMAPPTPIVVPRKGKPK
jgi:hypothetical protein